MRSLDVVLKTAERCNLNCSYCYFFNGLDQTYLKRPKFIKKDTIDHLANFLNCGVENLDIKSIHVVLHGGEPLMQPKDDFIYLIETLKRSLDKIELSFSIQTNATLVTNKWVDLLNQYNVGVGVSIDGPQEYHDKYRIDHNGNGSHDQVVRGIHLLQDRLFSNLGCLTVINPDFEGRKIYRHLVDLGFKKLDFLLPDNNHANLPLHDIKKYTKFLVDVFDEWMKDDDADISIRKFKSIILQLLGQAPLIYGFGRSTAKENIPILAIRSDGDISPTDELMSTDPESVTFTGKNVSNTTLKDILKHKVFDEIKQAHHTIPDKCSKCCWYNACGSGNLVSRYSKENRFNNHSVYCDSLQEIFAHASSYLINSGLNQQIITNNLFRNNEAC
jgi:uncharacterized protein